MIMSRLLLRNDIFRTEIFSILGAQDAAEATKTTEDDQTYYRAKTKPLKGK
jgi:hypothetical protein